SDSLSVEQKGILCWLFSPPYSVSLLEEPTLKPVNGARLMEIGPSAGLSQVTRVELSRRHLIKVRSIDGEMERLICCLYDSMTECVYSQPITLFAVDIQSQEVFEVDILGKGRAALEKANDELGLAFDSWDLDYYTALFQKVKRNPTSVECFDLAQSNSEHSRHWFFRGRMIIDGDEQKDTLFSLIMGTQHHSNQNNVIKFCDNSSGIKGMELECMYPTNPAQASPYKSRHASRQIIFTAETHNFPTGVAPFSRATTGTGRRIRDVQSAGKGGHVIAGTAGYCFGNLHIPGFVLPWEEDGWEYPSSFAPPLQVAIEASDGASDYGNKFGEPVLAGFARSFGMRLVNGERRKWIKPIMFSGGLGSIEDQHVKKELAAPGMEVVKIGGPVYRIGVGGGAASSVQVQGDNSSARDLGAVQRGDAEMEQKMNQALRACLEREEGNPICSIHDQGAGGNGNVLKELSEPAGAVIYRGDPTLSVLELWGAEYQESNALLLRPSDRSFLERVCQREKCPVDFVDKITGDVHFGKLLDNCSCTNGLDSGRCPVDLELDWVLGKMPQKEFVLERMAVSLQPLSLPVGLSVLPALERVLRLPAVASKRYLTNKVQHSLLSTCIVIYDFFIVEYCSGMQLVGQKKVAGSLVISVYAVCPDITATVTPDLDNPDGKGVLLYVPGSSGKYRLGGSALAQCYGQLGDCSPDLDQLDKLSACFNTTQILIQDRLLTTGHDVSDGGLISCLLEMAFAGNHGMSHVFPHSSLSVMEALFSEELGLVLEVCERNASSVCQRYTDAGLLCHRIGRTSGFGPDVIVSVCGQEVLNEHLPTLRAIWESTSFQLERLQANPLCVQEKEEGLASRTQPYIKLTFDPSQTPIIKELSSGKACVAVMREEGSNGDREIAASLFMAGFEVWDVAMQDLCSGSTTLDPFRAVVFVGGFRYADVLGSAKGWAATVTFNPKAREEFDRFRNRDDTLSLGVCNGCQLMALLGWVGEREDGGSDVTLTHNKSGRFESRFVSVGILPSPAVMLKGMEGSALGIWVAHGEGLMQFRSPEAQKKLIDASLAPLRYLDDSGTPTEIYPMNPNGSAQGVAGICSADGRHLAMMPHPERAVLGWQWAWAPQHLRGSLEASLWLSMFRSAAVWCQSS
uniref:Phosphoribosylformylglycinamidine synthase n=1 Tax=Cyprinus carpio TaxID=7962 RepID=A0A8C2PS13_CYPCA